MLGIIVYGIWKKHPPTFVFLSVGKSVGVTPKSVGFHRFSPTKLTDNLNKNRCKKSAVFFVWKSRPIFVSVGKLFGGTQALDLESESGEIQVLAFVSIVPFYVMFK